MLNRLHIIGIYILIGLIGISYPTLAQEQPRIIPAPVSVQFQTGTFTITSLHSIRCAETHTRAARYLQDYLYTFYQLRIPIDSGIAATVPTTYPGSILMIDDPAAASEAYSLRVSAKGIQINASPTGSFYAVQTIIQLLPVPKNAQVATASIPYVQVTDRPRFAYRGMHLDVGRHFFSVDDVKRYIDFLAWHKLNTLHWHLTEDQGWRIQIDAYPRLTDIGSYRDQTLVGAYGSGVYDGKKYGGFYTKDQIRSIVAYAADRHITIIPEIEMPGHSMAALSAYPALGCTGGPYTVMQTWGVSDDVLCAGKENTFTFLESVLTEVMALFPSTYIHIGGDECPKERWKKCSNCQQRIHDEKLTDEYALQRYFIGRIERFLNKHGRRIIGWDEILEGGLTPDATVMSWRGEAGGIEAARQGHDVIMTPGKPLYFDHTQRQQEDSVTQGGYNSLKDVYNYDPIPATLNDHEKKFIKGAQANLWTEYINNMAKLEYMLFPRIAALSEVVWTMPANKNWQAFEKNLSAVFNRYQWWNIRYCKAYYDLQYRFTKAGNPPLFQLVVTTPDSTQRIHWTKPDGTTSISDSYTVNIHPTETGTYSFVGVDVNGNRPGSAINLPIQVNQATGASITLRTQPHASYATGGPLTLVDGVRNTLGMSRSSQFLGFWGGDLDATLDLGQPTSLSVIRLHCFEQPASWIYAPKRVELLAGNDLLQLRRIGTMTLNSTGAHPVFEIHKKLKVRYLKIIAANKGRIPDGQPGSGHDAWLFADEISVE